MINTNLPPIFHRFRDTAFDRSKIAIFGYPTCVSPPPRRGLNPEGFPWDDLRNIFRGCQWMAKVPNGVETLSKFSTGWAKCTSVTDRQTTDRWQTDGRQHIVQRLLIKLLQITKVNLSQANKATTIKFPNVNQRNSRRLFHFGPKCALAFNSNSVFRLLSERLKSYLAETVFQIQISEIQNNSNTN